MLIYTADFETHASIKNMKEEITGVWLWDICDIELYKHYTGETLYTFIEKCFELSPCIIYFHNLKFDGIFILDYLLKNGFVHTYNKLQSKEFTTLITDMGLFFSITVCFKAGNKKKKYTVEFRDSAKKINGSVEKIAESYNLPFEKGIIDYTADRNNHKITQDEITYIQKDTEIIARVLNILYSKGMDKITTSSDTYNLYKKTVGVHYKYIFPVLSLEIDDYIRNSYRGGVCQVNEDIQGIWQNEDHIYDINSMYPFQMCTKKLPYGSPIYYKGKYTKDNKYNLYIQRVRVNCKLKNGYRPTVLKNNCKWIDKNYLIDTDMEIEELTLTSVDLALLLKHYEIFDIQYIDGYKFLSSNKLFKHYLEPIYKRKCETNGAEKETEKLKLNGLYGKLAENPRHGKKEPYLNENGIIQFKATPIEITKPKYTAVSSFITAYAREQLFTTIQDNIENFLYCDTDSVHLKKPIKNAEIDSRKLGAWKCETKNKRVINSCYLAPKSYMLIFEDGTKEIKLAGCPDIVKNQMTKELFTYGSTFNGKLIPKRVKGGTILYPTTFTIKER